MPYMVLCRDNDGSAPARERSLPAHRSYVDDNAGIVLLSGPLTDDDGRVRRGQLFVLDVPDAASARAFVDGDPLTLAGVFATVDVQRLLVRFEAGGRVSSSSLEMGPDPSDPPVQVD